MSARILVVEDDPDVRDAVTRGLALHGFDVAPVADAETARTAVAARHPEAMVVDVGLPGRSGIELCELLRADGVDTPVLILSARDSVADRVAGLAAGADDYVVKPFDLDELVLRLRALLRRARPATATEVIAVGALWLDLDRRTVSVDGAPVSLSRREFDLLAALARNAGIVLSRIRLIELVWDYNFDVDTNVVDVFVGYVRRKLAAAGLPTAIETVRGVGFVLRKP